ncbi:uncharacterized protein LOC135370231 [Ornithodoros turicata]|uniref:uncharacterized protein LOC135370231 n=1 Tax=Ornithodoros turicata TaxID=34597 RepID=UPI003139E2C6
MHAKKMLVFIVLGVGGAVLMCLAYTSQGHLFWIQSFVDGSFSAPREYYVLKTSGCKIPNFDPMDKTVEGLYRYRSFYTCSGRPSFIVQKDSTLLVDAKTLKKYYHMKPKNVICFYKPIFRDEKQDVPDEKIVFGARTRVRFGLPLSAEYIVLECIHKGQKFHEEILLVPILKSEVEDRCERAAENLDPSVERLNVVFLGLDSVSRLNSLRHLKETRRYLEENFDPIELLGYNKLGDNSFPNQVPLLTGRLDKEVMASSPDRFFDNQSFVWKTYADLGYRTLFMEESPRYGLFNYLNKGFRKIPTDYYTRPAILAIDSSRDKRFVGMGQPCVGAKPQTVMYLDYTLSLLSLLGDRSYFTYTWISDVTHDDLNSAGYADIPFRRMFENLDEAGVMNSSLVIFLSDHGMRYGPLRTTLMGKYEDRLPFCFLMFPASFKAKHPEAMKNLRINQHRLTTHFDVHATLVELANLQLPNATYTTKHGTSLLHEIPEDRTCEDASITPHWCCCHESGSLPTKSKLSKRLAIFLVGTINKWLSDQAPGKCKALRLKSVTDVRKVLGGDSADVDYYWVTITTLPGNAILEGTVGVNETGTYFVDRVSRLNWYGGQSNCVSIHALELYCYCKR